VTGAVSIPVSSAAKLVGAPAEYALPEVRPSVEEARAWCRHLATTHYENFHVATWFLPRRVRPHFESIYAFSRVADDLGDEVADTETALRLLGDWREMLAECYARPLHSIHPVFVALRETIEATGVPEELFADLIAAFEQDQRVTHHESMDSLIAYSSYSANPVGRLVLWVSGYKDEERALLSDKVCTGLQLANFWQDVVEDWERGRRYLPADAMARFGVTNDDIQNKRFTPQMQALMEHLVGYAGQMLTDGAEIVRKVDAELGVTLRLFVWGGQAALGGVVAQGYDVLARRPSVTKGTKIWLMVRALAAKAASLVWRGDAAR
jgi:squalene synthase HpnC